MRCPACGQENREGARFCRACGAGLEESLTFLADVVPAAQALLVCSHRPGYRHVFGDRSYHVRIALRALSEPEATAARARATVDGLVRALPEPELQAALRALAAG